MINIFLVTRQKSVFGNIPVISSTEAVRKLEGIDVISCDTENSGLDFMTKDVLTLQTGNADFQIVWDVSTIDISVLKDIMKTKLTIWQYAVYDLPFMYSKGLYPENIWDDMAAEKLIYHGYTYDMLTEEAKRYGCNCTPFSLDMEARKYCNIILDKSIRGKMTVSGLTKETIRYAACDIEPEEEIMRKQRAILHNMGMLPAIRTENNFIRCCAYAKWCGTKINISKWDERFKDVKKELQKLSAEITKAITDRYVSNCTLNGNEYKEKYKDYITEKEPDLFYDGPKYTLNMSIDNTSDMINIINMIIPDTATDPSRKDVLDMYRRYLTIKNESVSYGTIKNSISKDGRVHIAYNGFSLNGRIYPDKNKYTHESINLMVIPKIMRSAVIPKDGNVWISADYSCQEMRVIAQEAHIKWMADAFNNGRDIYSMVAAAADKSLSGYSDEEIMKNYADARNKAKTDFISRVYGKAEVFKDAKDYMFHDDIDDGRMKLCRKTGFSGLLLPKDGNEAFQKLISGTASTMMKIACILLYNHVRDNGLWGKVLFTIPLHDEINIECPEDIKGTMIEMIKNDMETAEKYLCPDIVPKVKISVSDKWE